MEFLEVPLFDDDVYKLLVRFGINLFFLTLIVALAIYPNQRQREFAFTAVMLNVIVFFICFTMKKLELDLGLALGLFAVFGVLRYRTDAIRPKEMTYLFIVIGIGVINSLSNKKTSYAEIALVNSLIFATAMLKEWFVGRTANGNGAGNGNGASNGNVGPKNGGSKNGSGIKPDKEKASEATGKKPPKYTVEYDRPQLLGMQHREALLDDLQERTGMDIARVEIKSINLTQNQATLTVWPASESLTN